jgi:thioredoxin-related protein
MKSFAFVSLPLVVLALGAAPIDSRAAAVWQTDLPKAQAQAKAENKAVLINFTGSDWCGWCIHLRKEVFSKPDFEEYAANNLVLVEIDFPRHKAQADSMKKANRALAGKFDVEGYPTVIILNADGKKIGQLGYMPGGTKAFLGELNKSLGKLPTATTPVNARAASTAAPTPASQTAAKNGKATKGTPAAPWPPTQNEGLVLKGISGPKEKRMALVNNQTLGQGETASVKVPGGAVRVHCVEIREGSVLVKIDGREGEHELKLWTGL